MNTSITTQSFHPIIGKISSEPWHEILLVVCLHILRRCVWKGSKSTILGDIDTHVHFFYVRDTNNDLIMDN